MPEPEASSPLPPGTPTSAGLAGETVPPILDPWEPLRARALTAAGRALEQLGWKGSPEELARALTEGPEGKADLALPVFRWAKTLGQRPDELARRLAGAVPALDGFEGVRAEGGFLNFHILPLGFASTTLGLIRELAEGYGRGPPRPEKVCVEHTSANPTGPLHVGRSRNAVIGDTYVRVLRASGYDVTVQFYVDDVGRQAAMLVWIWSKPTARWPAEIRDQANLPPDGRPPAGLKADQWYGRAYPPAAQYIREHEEAARELSDLSARMESGRLPVEEYRRIPREILEGIVASLARMNVAFDEFVWESDFTLDGSVAKALARVRASPRFRRLDDGAEGVDGADLGLPEESPLVFLTRADGTDLYPARDLAYHLQKLARFGRVIDVLGEDHKLHFKGVLALLEASGETRRPEVLIYGFINLPEGRMTTRGGRVVNLDEVLDEARDRASAEVRRRREDLSEDQVARVAESVGAGAVRFHILRVQPEKPIVFRWEEALSFEGKSAPFVQYAHARACSLLRRAAGGDDRPMIALPALPASDLPPRLDPKEEALLRALSRLPGLVARVAENGSVHLMALYAHEVAERFNEFYQALRVLDSEPAVRPLRLTLVSATRQVLHNVLTLIGVDALERM